METKSLNGFHDSKSLNGFNHDTETENPPVESIFEEPSEDDTEDHHVRIASAKLSRREAARRAPIAARR